MQDCALNYKDLNIQEGYGVTISKQQLADLPAAAYTGKAFVVDSEEDAGKAAEVLRNADIIGFDTETKPSFKRGATYNVALLQLSTRDTCFLIRLNHIGLPKPIQEILENPSLLKVGVSIHDDFRNLRKVYDLNPEGFIDLQNFVKDFGIVDNSLSRIYAVLFGKRISKGQRLTNWEASELTAHQCDYAALDALSCIEIYERLRTEGFDPAGSPYLTDLVELARIQEEHAEQARIHALELRQQQQQAQQQQPTEEPAPEAAPAPVKKTPKKRHSRHARKQ